jgi:hypothetical protein
VTLAVIVDTISDRVLRRQRMPVFQWHRLALTRCELDIWRLNGRGRRPTFGVVPALRVAVMEKCCDACGDGVNYFRLNSSAAENVGVQVASSSVDRKSLVPTVAERSCKHADFLCVS